MAKLTREELYALAWNHPMTKLAKKFGLSDVALHKICRKHDIPTPPLGYWAKKAHGKPVADTPLPKSPKASQYHIVIYEGAGSAESEAVAVVRARAREAMRAQDNNTSNVLDDPILGRTIERLSKAKADRTGLAQIEGKNLITVAIRPESATRAQRVLETLVRAAQMAGMTLGAGGTGTVWHADGEEISFDLVEVADRVEHIPTEAELKAVAKWEAEREAYRKRYSYDRDWGRPHIPKWEERYQGRLAVRLEKVRIRTENEYWGPTIRGTFADAKNRDIMKAIPSIVSAIAAIAVAKRENREADERRSLARAESEARRRETERRAALEHKRSAMLKTLITAHEEMIRLESFLLSLDKLHERGHVPDRLSRFMAWGNARLERMQRALAPGALEEQLALEAIFDAADVERAGQ